MQPVLGAGHGESDKDRAAGPQPGRHAKRRRRTEQVMKSAGEEESDGIFRISDMVEKPSVDVAPSNLAIIGRYVLTPDIFPILKNTAPGKNNELQITDALRTQAREGNVIGYKFRGRRFDCGSIEGFMEATDFVYSKIKMS